MASYQKYSTKQGQKWLFKIDSGTNPQTGKRKTTTRRGFKTKKEAQTSAVKLEQELENGLLIDFNNLTYHDIFNQWFSDHARTIKNSTKKTITSKFKIHILPRFGKLKMKDITKAYCQKMINEIADNIASVNDIKIQANQVFKYALKMDIIMRNPMEHVSIPKQQKEILSEGDDSQQRNYWSKGEIKQFLEITEKEVSIRDHVLFHLFIYTGARKGELLAISWDDIDFEASSIRFGKTLFQTNGEFLLQTPKTKASKRLISLDSKSLNLLRKLRIHQKEEKLSNLINIENNKFVFTREDGSPLRSSYLNEKLAMLAKKHKLHKITIHGFRHTHASLLFEAGATIKEVQERLGHSDIHTTMNIYTHVTDYLKEQTATKFQKYMEQL
ncbi:site-specific integrase [Virgibacillus litoralis]|uniref:Integrase n=1 Tax=Virgibacillus litoralis TaxID=578221 RepID=A0ABS4HGI6_9BACI|nr:site-specific integrase [Virgibacillus litoralis]MBP1950040.1 integrase [Virgibacillus litoralis]